MSTIENNIEVNHLPIMLLILNLPVYALMMYVSTRAGWLVNTFYVFSMLSLINYVAVTSNTFTSSKGVFGFNGEMVGRSALDYNSFGHVAMGVFATLVVGTLIPFFSIDYTFGYYVISPELLMTMMVIVLAVTWEVFENEILIHIRYNGESLKYRGRKDSGLNLSVDILLVILGGITSLLFYANPNFTWITLGFGGSLLVLYGISRKKTHEW